ncbi:MAG: 3-phosphoshikimate 1-carboxyvinyltransferase [Sulfobacillus sp.]
MIKIGPTEPIDFSGQVPGDKSISHRALILSALASGVTVIEGLLHSADTTATWQCLRALGADIQQDPTGSVRVRGMAGRLSQPDQPLQAANSGTTARLLLGVLAAAGVQARLDGDDSLRQRPMRRVVEPLRAMGAEIDELGSSYRLPLQVHPASLHAANLQITVASAQVKSALLLAALGADGHSEVRLPQPSRDHTERMLAPFGVRVSQQRDPDGGEVVALDGPRRLSTPGRLRVPGDPSSAAFLWAAAAVTGGRAEVSGVCLNARRIGFLHLLAEMGVQVQITVDQVDIEPVGRVVVTGRPTRAGLVSGPQVADMIDELPLAACVMAVAPGLSRVEGAAELSVKESDRIAAMAQGLSALGVACTPTSDGWRIAGGRRIGHGQLDSHGDHRVGMALSVAAMAGSDVSTLLGDRVWEISYPTFLEQMQLAGGQLERA